MKIEIMLGTIEDEVIDQSIISEYPNGIDVTASIAKLFVQIEKAVEEKFPQATVTATGSPKFKDTVIIDGKVEWTGGDFKGIGGEIACIAGSVWVKNENWWVEK